MKRYVIGIDTETTGLDPEVHHVIQIGGICLEIDTETNECRVIGVLDRMVNPGNDVEIPEEITKITGLTRQMLNTAGTIDQAITDLNRLLFMPIPVNASPMPAEVFVVGHNLGFDLGFLNAACGEFDRSRNHLKIHWPTNFTTHCTIGISSFHFGRRLKLQDLCVELGITRPKWMHRAFADAAAAAACYCKLQQIRKVGRWEPLVPAVWETYDTEPFGDIPDNFCSQMTECRDVLRTLGLVRLQNEVPGVL